MVIAVIDLASVVHPGATQSSNREYVEECRTVNEGLSAS
jgi:hypothetical protein